MSWHDDCSSTAAWTVTNDGSFGLLSDGTSFKVNDDSITENVGGYGVDAERDIPISGDFDVTVNITIPNIDLYHDENTWTSFDFYLNTDSYFYKSDGTNGRKYFDFYFVKDGIGANKIYLYGFQSSTEGITLTLPFTGDLRVTRVNGIVTTYVGETVLWQSTYDNSGFACTNIDLYWNVSGHTIYPFTPSSIKVNDVNVIGNTTTPIDTKLSAMTITSSQGYIMTPSFSSTIFSYSKETAYACDNAIFTLTSQDSSMTITVNGTAVQSGVASSPFNLAYGNNVFTIICTNGTVSSTYTVTIIRHSTASTDSTLSQLGVFWITPTFSPTVYSYSKNETATTTRSTGTITSTSPYASIKINDIPHVSDTIKYFDLNCGDNSFTIVVTAEDGITTSTYTLNIYREYLSNDAGLNYVTLMGTFGDNYERGYWDRKYNSCRRFNMVLNSSSSNYWEYTATDLKCYDRVCLMYYEQNNGYSKVLVNGANYVRKSNGGNFYPMDIQPIFLNEGDNTITVNCIAQDGVTVNTWVIHANVPAKYKYAHGTGTKDDPYQVWTAEDLDRMREYPGNRFSKYYNMPIEYFKQMADIDLSGYASWEPIGTWEYYDLPPYRTSEYGNIWYYDEVETWYNGFDGNGFAISNMTINKDTNHKAIGFFSTLDYILFSDNSIDDTSTVKIKNIKILNANIKLCCRNVYAGILVGQIYSPVNYIWVEGIIDGPEDNPPDLAGNSVITRYFGGMAGFSNSSCTWRCFAKSEITLYNHIGDNSPIIASIGGLVGYLGGSGTAQPGDKEKFGIFETYVHSKLNYPSRKDVKELKHNLLGDYYQTYGNTVWAGGFYGEKGIAFNTWPTYYYNGTEGIHSVVNSGYDAFTIKNCYCISDITIPAEAMIGGFAGMYDSKFVNCYCVTKMIDSAAQVTRSVGGFVGYGFYNNVFIQYCDDTNYILYPVLQDTCYFDYDVYTPNAAGNTNIDYPDGSGTAVCGNARHTTAMKTQSTFIGWDFENIWGLDPNIENGYPYLRWINPNTVNVYVKHSGVWIQADTVYIKKNGAWIQADNVNMKKSGTWY